MISNDTLKQDKNKEITEINLQNSELKNNVAESNLFNLNLKKAEKERNRIKKTGVCYLSKIPDYMKPSKIRSVLSKFGEINRIFLKPEDFTIYNKRVKYGGNKKKKYTGGWVEFSDKKKAMVCANTLNGRTLGGKKSSFYHDDVMNIKYLSNFKWFDLTQQLKKEKELRDLKLQLEISMQNKVNKNFVSNIEKSNLIQKIEDKKKLKNKKSDPKSIKRNFIQKEVLNLNEKNDTDIDSNYKKKKLNSVLSKIF